jgi:TRAP-type C4-dicarboxylate transport system substrate-binding protein
MMFGSFPFIFRDSSGYIDAFTKEDTLEKLATDYLAEVGYKNVLVTGTYYVGFYQMGFKNKEPKVPSDLKGLKVRSLGAIQPFFDRYGITSVNVNTPDVYDSLERGLIDGAIGVYSNWVDWGWGEPATYLVDVNLAAVGLYFAVSKASLAGLRPDDRAVVEKFLKSLQEALNAEYVKSDQTYKTTITARQLMKIYSPNAQETKAWFESRDEVVQKWVKDVGPRGAQALKVIEKYNAPK